MCQQRHERDMNLLWRIDEAAVAKLLTSDEARRIAATIARLPELLRKG